MATRKNRQLNNQISTFESFEGFESLSKKFTGLEPGKYLVTLKHFEFVPATQRGQWVDGEFIPDRDSDGNPIMSKPYVNLELADIGGKGRAEKKIYANSIQMFMDNICAQTDGNTAAMTLKEILAYTSENPVTVWVSMNGRYGKQVDFFDRPAWEERKRAGAVSTSGNRRETEERALARA